MVIGMSVNSIMLWLHPVAFSIGKAHMTNLALACQTPISILGALFLIPQMGFIGAAIMYTLATIFGCRALFSTQKHVPTVAPGHLTLEPDK